MAYYITTKNKTFVLGYNKWLSKQEAIFDSAQVIRFKNYDHANKIIIRFSKKDRGTCTPIEDKNLATAWAIRITNTGEFLDDNPNLVGEPISAHMYSVINEEFPNPPAPKKRAATLELTNPQNHQNKPDESATRIASSPTTEELSISITEDSIEDEDEPATLICTTTGISIAGIGAGKPSESECAKKILYVIDTLIDGKQYVERVCCTVQNEIQQTQRKITDERHYIEFYNLNAKEGFEAYKRLRELLRERRMKKDAQAFSSKMKTLIDEINITDLLRLKSEIKQQDSRRYQLRCPDDFIHLEQLQGSAS